MNTDKSKNKGGTFIMLNRHRTREITAENGRGMSWQAKAECISELAAVQKKGKRS